MIGADARGPDIPGLSPRHLALLPDERGILEQIARMYWGVT
jgi:hypothetical protein